MSFNNFNTIVQTTANSCGAFALAAALENFPLAQQTQQAHLLNTANLALGYSGTLTAVANTGTPQAFAESIYAVTGNLLLGAGEATYQYTEPAATNMNPPSAMVYIATLFGYVPKQIAVKYNNTGMQMFTAFEVTNLGNGGDLLNTEIEQLLLINNQQGMVIAGPLDYTDQPLHNQVQIILVQDGQHWLAINSTELYDPGTGYVGPYDLVLDEDGQQSFNYTMDEDVHENGFSGIWIQLNSAV